MRSYSASLKICGSRAVAVAEARVPLLAHGKGDLVLRWQLHVARGPAALVFARDDRVPVVGEAEEGAGSIFPEASLDLPANFERGVAQRVLPLDPEAESGHRCVVLRVHDGPGANAFGGGPLSKGAAVVGCEGKHRAHEVFATSATDDFEGVAHSRWILRVDVDLVGRPGNHRPVLGHGLDGEVNLVLYLLILARLHRNLHCPGLMMGENC